MSQTSPSIPSFSANCVRDSHPSQGKEAGRSGALVRRGVGRLHCLLWDADTGLTWAELLARLRTTGKAMPIKVSFIAATAAVHGLAVATRNRADFVNAGVRIVDPFVG